jgi:shikimate kinase
MKGESGGHVFLVGFMGSGKSTVGRALATRLSRPFLDVDCLIEETAGQSIADIFRESTESEFRRLELAAIQSCRRLDPSVIALGGGAFVLDENRKLVSETGVSIWLDCPLEVCLERVRGDKTRPLLGTDSEMRRLLEARIPYYQMASIVVHTGDRTAEQIAYEILELEPFRRP